MITVTSILRTLRPGMRDLDTKRSFSGIKTDCSAYDAREDSQFALVDTFLPGFEDFEHELLLYHFNPN